MPWNPALVSIARRRGPAGRLAHRGSLDVAERHRLRERRQVLRAHLRGRFVAGSELDQRPLAERAAEEADAEGNAEDHARGDLDDGIAAGRRDAGGAEDEVVAEDEVGGPG